MGFFNFLYQAREAKQEYKPQRTIDLTTLYPPRDLTMSLSTNQVRVPLELVMNVLDSAYYDDEPESNVQLFTNCALVCKDWSAIAQKLLFRRVTLRSQTDYIAFQQAVDRSTARGRMLGDAVRSMRVTLDHNQPYYLSQRSFARAVTLCPNMQDLRLAMYGQGSPGHDVVGAPDVNRMKRAAPSFDERTLALLRTGPSIASLQFSNWSDNSSTLFQLLDVWPALKSLAISGVPPQLPNESPQPFPCALDSLRMNFQTPPCIDFMRWLLHNSTDSLRTLELEREPAPDMLRYLLANHAGALQSLAMPTCGGHEGTAAIRQCRALRELRIESPWTPPTLCKALPEAMEHIAFGVDMATPLPPILQMIKRSETLKAVTVHIWHGGESHPQLNALKIACARQGVELMSTTDVREFRSIARDVLHSSTSVAGVIY
ncbi:hypothetical protein IEO21_09062 [Rhodonia placenta]|uniref:F-box domain-containing protein n=1 Tax=Rhodonia placenta TaxID=104341 RepID=A0A8H7NUZ8_9APHY|nr:hypothetical protein IEO21_09062 [Postia placenta]